jgi:peptidoglycan hydrolase-like protein with peptidoglycan-binding domain
MKFAPFVACGIALFSTAALAGGSGHQDKQSSQQQGTPSSEQHANQATQSPGTQQDSDTVKQAQEQLSSLGHDAGPADGIMGPKTQAAVKEFQESKGLQVSGRLDSQTLAALQTGGSEGASDARSTRNPSSSGQSMSSQPSSSASPSGDTQSAAPSSSQQSKY